MKILAFGHKSRVGKDEATKILLSLIHERQPDLKVERRAFADKVKEISHILYKHFGLQPGPYYDEHPEARAIKLPTLNMDPVEVWVSVGNKMREIYPETWVDIVLLDSSADIVIIPDTRYINEINRIHQLGGICARIDRKDAPIRDTVADNALNGYTGWYQVFQNNGKLSDLRIQMEIFLDHLKWLK